MTRGETRERVDDVIRQRRSKRGRQHRQLASRTARHVGRLLTRDTGRYQRIEDPRERHTFYIKYLCLQPENTVKVRHRSPCQRDVRKDSRERDKFHPDSLNDD